jgi:glycosyltransferase involved in cell wall biosynthesis
MNILFATIAWPAKGERNIYTDLMDEFVAQGHNVNIICARERRTGRATEFCKEKGYYLLRVRCGNLQKTSIFEKGLTTIFLNHLLLRAFEKFYASVRFDLIICSTPPITLSPLIVKLKRRYNAMVYLLLKDMWPQGPVDMGAIRKNSLIWKYFRRKEQQMYHCADYIGCMSPAGVRYVLRHNPELDPHRVEECPNAACPISLSQVDTRGIREKYAIPFDAVVFVLGGNIGKPQGLDFLVDAIRATQGNTRLYFLIIGSGTHFQKLNKTFLESKFSNAALYEWLPKADFDCLLQTCDVGLILLDKKYTVPHFPSRLLSYLEAEKPVLCAVNAATDIGTIVEQAECGISVLHGDLDGFIAAALKFADDAGRRKEMGRNARELLKSRYTAHHAYEIIIRHFTGAQNRGKEPPLLEPDSTSHTRSATKE